MKKEIPTNLEECFEELNEIFGERVDSFKETDEKTASVRCHHALGRKLRNSWGLWKGSDLKDYFKDMGLLHADDMSSIIITSYHRSLNGKPIDLEGQVQYYKDYWTNRKNGG